MTGASGLDRADILDLLGSLVEKSLVTFENGRYGMLQTVRQYGRERLREDPVSEELTKRHASFLRDVLEGADEGLSGPDQAAWMGLVDRELDNLRAALDAMLEPRSPGHENLATARELAVSTWKYWSRRGLGGEGLSYLRRCAEGHDGDPRLLAAVCSAAGVLATYRGDNADAAAFLERALDLRRGLGDPDPVARTLNNMGMLATNVGEFDKAREHYSEAIELIRANGPSYAYATMLLNLGNLERYTGNDDAARSAYEECRSVFHRVEDYEGEALTIYNLGLLHADHGDQPTAIELFEEALRGFEDVGNERMAAWTLAAIGSAWLSTGDRSRALEPLKRSTKMRLEMAERLSVALALQAWAELMVCDGRYREVALLLGGFDALREDLDMSLTPAQVTDYDKVTAKAVASLGEEEFRDLHARGAGISPAELLAACSDQTHRGDD